MYLLIILDRLTSLEGKNRNIKGTAPRKENTKTINEEDPQKKQIIKKRGTT